MNYKQTPLPQKKRIALVAHDNRKDVMCQWALRNHATLAEHTLNATGTTGYLLEKTLNLPVNKFLSGPLGGDQQVGAKIAEGKVDLLLFFWDPFEPLPHDPDVKALLRVAAVWNIPVACNEASADFMIASPFLHQPYERQVPDYDQYLAMRVSKL